MNNGRSSCYLTYNLCVSRWEKDRVKLAGLGSQKHKVIVRGECLKSYWTGMRKASGWPCCRVQELGRYLLWRDTIGGSGLIIILHTSLTDYFYLFQGKYAHRSSDK